MVTCLSQCTNDRFETIGPFRDSVFIRRISEGCESLIFVWILLGNNTFSGDKTKHCTNCIVIPVLTYFISSTQGIISVIVDFECD